MISSDDLSYLRFVLGLEYFLKLRLLVFLFVPILLLAPIQLLQRHLKALLLLLQIILVRFLPLFQEFTFTLPESPVTIKLRLAVLQLILQLLQSLLKCQRCLVRLLRLLGLSGRFLGLEKTFL